MEKMDKEARGCKNESADKIKRNNVTWSDTNLNRDFSYRTKDFDRLECRECGGTHFEVLTTGSYETTAKCLHCEIYYIVHCG